MARRDPTGRATGSRSASPTPGIGMTRRADPRAVPGVHPGRRLDHAQVRRHRPRPGHHPPLLPDDGRRRHGAERARRGQHLHDQGPRHRVRRAAAEASEDARPTTPADVGRERWPRLRARHLRARHRRRPDPARPDAPVPEQGGLPRRDGDSGEEGLRLARRLRPDRDHARRDDARAWTAGASSRRSRPTPTCATSPSSCSRWSTTRSGATPWAPPTT